MYPPRGVTSLSPTCSCSVVITALLSKKVGCNFTPNRRSAQLLIPASTEALSELHQLLISYPFLLQQHLLPLISSISHLISDPTPTLRTATLALLTYIFSLIPVESLESSTQALSLFTLSALSSLDEGVKVDALKTLNLLLEMIPETIVRGWDYAGAGQVMDEQADGIGSKVVDALLGVLRVRSAGLAVGQGGYTSAASSDLSPSVRSDLAPFSTFADDFCSLVKRFSSPSPASSVLPSRHWPRNPTRRRRGTCRRPSTLLANMPPSSNPSLPPRKQRSPPPTPPNRSRSTSNRSVSPSNATPSPPTLSRRSKFPLPRRQKSPSPSRRPSSPFCIRLYSPRSSTRLRQRSRLRCRSPPDPEWIPIFRPSQRSLAYRRSCTGQNWVAYKSAR